MKAQGNEQKAGGIEGVEFVDASLLEFRWGAFGLRVRVRVEGWL